MLIIGALLTVGFTYLFGLDSAVLHGLMISSLAIVISAMLFMIVQVDHPFSGQVHVTPDPFEAVLATFTN